MGAGWLGIVGLLRGLVVETGSPDALCPDLASTEQAISARLGALEVSGNWRVRYTIAHAPDAPNEDFVRLELYDQENRVRLARDLPLAGEACGTMAQVIALVLDRFFRTLGEDATPTTSASEASGTANRGPAPKGRSRATSSVVGRPFVLSLQGGILGEPTRPTTGFSLAAPLARNFSLAMALTWAVLPARASLSRSGEAELQTMLIRFDPSWDVALGVARWGLGPTLSFALEYGSATAPLNSEGKFRTVLAPGASTSLKFPLVFGLFVGLGGGLELPFRPFGGRFLIENEEVLVPPTSRAFLQVEIGSAIFR